MEGDSDIASAQHAWRGSGETFRDLHGDTIVDLGLKFNLLNHDGK
ncbi:hypothetical protein [Rheinheimera hassiensis]|nr:hypothetical protein [Rheinheimera hassiensis]